jgi:hypothetical protein
VSGTVLILAHLGHWYVSLPVYLGPFLAIAVWLKWSSYREGRRRRDEANASPPEPPDERDARKR